MDIERINHNLTLDGVLSAGRVHWFDSIGSTNDFLLKHAGDFHGVVCLAGEQTAGRGRRGRQWISSPGQGIYLSLGWHLQGAAPGGLSLVCGLSVLAALSRMEVSDLSLKWPNDVLLNHAKLGGILVEMSGERCVIGIGLNVKLPADPAVADDAPRTALPATGLAEQGFHIDAELLAANLITQLNRDLERFCREGFGPFAQNWNDVHAYHGALVEVSGSRQIHGRVVGVDGDGALRLETDGGLQSFHAGEVSLRSTGLIGRDG